MTRNQILFPASVVVGISAIVIVGGLKIGKSAGVTASATAVCSERNKGAPICLLYSAVEALEKRVKVLEEQRKKP